MLAIANETGLFVPDIALAFQLLHFVRCYKRDGDFKYQISFSINWDKVQTHHEKVMRQNNRIPIDSECLRWTPLLTPALHMLKSDSEGESTLASIDRTTSPEKHLSTGPNKRISKLQLKKAQEKTGK